MFGKISLKHTSSRTLFEKKKALCKKGQVLLAFEAGELKLIKCKTEKVSHAFYPI